MDAQHRSIELIHRDLQIAQQEVTIAELRTAIAVRDLTDLHGVKQEAQSYVAKFAAELKAATTAAVAPPEPIRFDAPLRVEIPTS